MAEKYTIYVKDPKTGKERKVTFGAEKESYAPDFKMVDDKPKLNVDDPKREPRKILNKDVGELLNEIIDPDSINVEQLKVKDELNPEVWNGEQMHPDVRQALLKNALEFIKFANLEDAKFKDIILTGSLANYNWHEGSDLDVHVLMDYDQISDDNEFVDDYFRTKKSLWGEQMPVTVKDHDVELYVQDINEPHTSTGVYSLLNDSWLTKPIRTMVALDIPNIRAKAINFMNIIDDLETNENTLNAIDEIEKVQDKLKNYRKAGLDDEGEFSTENLVFKILRNTGYLEKLSNMKKNVLAKELTLENVSMYDPGTVKDMGLEGDLSGYNLNEASVRDAMKRAIRKGTFGIGIVVGLLTAGMTAQDIQQNYDIPTDMILKAKELIGFDVEADTLSTVNKSI